MEIIVETQDVGVPDERRDNIMIVPLDGFSKPLKIKVMSACS